MNGAEFCGNDLSKSSFDACLSQCCCKFKRVPIIFNEYERLNDFVTLLVGYAWHTLKLYFDPDTLI
ncbi:hypothetical protein GCM10011607_24990 [Shewanella inventionis]|uniref:Uncharacterized protein n=1 Tax=Shewanella inventionis TaxID=1738770 RepID=A0ABQ1JC09_9GAMM|nr:hypothetical protein GCM10011607_24990 [Shewanella inventionis]